MYISTPQNWATSLFGQANLGDQRRTKRLVKVATNLALHTGKSLVKSSQQPTANSQQRLKALIALFVTNLFMLMILPKPDFKQQHKRLTAMIYC
ncbi:hypothetical protein PBPRB1486 [Photobacterium profundum SS9]|uniref:Transposase Tn5-like N-terminal domain-containing protein n=1 Tax=Photobacterium profundum (strain SS9) TaxID=298386 RepID=Q6LH78_PHOPR|nr:hypothetical protein PBPRB1486 [Photobacterium profundum SS9]